MSDDEIRPMLEEGYFVRWFSRNLSERSEETHEKRKGTPPMVRGPCHKELGKCCEYVTHLRAYVYVDRPTSTSVAAK
jgi:hypothetical protein